MVPGTASALVPFGVMSRAGRGLVPTGVPARRAEGMRRAGRHLAVVRLAPAGLPVSDASGKLGVDGLHVRLDRHVRGRAGGDQAEAGAQLAPGGLEFGGAELADIVRAGHAVSTTQ